MWEGVTVPSLVRQIIVWSLVKDKEERHLIMMEQNGVPPSASDSASQNVKWKSLLAPLLYVTIYSNSCDDVMSLPPGLDRITYWLIKMNFNGFLFTIVCIVVTIVCLIFQLRLFTQVSSV